MAQILADTRISKLKAKVTSPAPVSGHKETMRTFLKVAIIGLLFGLAIAAGVAIAVANY